MGTTITQKLGLSEKQADTIKKVAIGVGTAALGVGIFMLARHVKKVKNMVNPIEQLKGAAKNGKIGNIESSVEEFGLSAGDTSKDVSVFIDKIKDCKKLPEKDIDPEMLNKIHQFVGGRPGSGRKSVAEALLKEPELSILKPNKCKELSELSPELKARIEEMLHSDKVTTLDAIKIKKFNKKA